jgi:hypothetical protein
MKVVKIHPSHLGSSEEPISTNEEPFAVGWAKALDTNSGSYYYFTLDRLKLCGTTHVAQSGASESKSEDESLKGANPLLLAAVI